MINSGALPFFFLIIILNLQFEPFAQVDILIIMVLVNRLVCFVIVG